MHFFKTVFEVSHEKINKSLAACGLCRYIPRRHAVAFSLRMDRFGTHRAILRRERINIGAHEAPFLTNAHLRRRAKPFRQGHKKLLVHKAPGNSSRPCLDPACFLPLQRHHRQIPRPDKYLHRLHRRRHSLQAPSAEPQDGKKLLLGNILAPSSVQNKRCVMAKRTPEITAPEKHSTRNFLGKTKSVSFCKPFIFIDFLPSRRKHPARHHRLHSGSRSFFFWRDSTMRHT